MISNKLTTSLFVTLVLICSSASAQMMSPEDRAAQAEKSANTEFNTTTLIDPNTASLEELSVISGLSADKAQAIIDNRPFATPTEMHIAIGGDNMSPEELFTIYSAVFVKVNLNSGANQDFQLVPTTLSARKLAHEFEEYRPYEKMDDFSREMKKYVSPKEVTFLERFVEVK